MIFQHISPDARIQKLAEVSIQSHQRYADLHGYEYRINLGDYVEQGDAGTGYMNKIYALLSVVLQELEKGSRAVEWIMLVVVLSITASVHLTLVRNSALTTVPGL